MSTDSFQTFVSEELPKRISTNDISTDVGAGLIPVSTGIGLSTTFKSASDIGFGSSAEIKIINVKDVPLVSYVATLPVGIKVENIIKPILVNLAGGSIVEVSDYTETDDTITLNSSDFTEIVEIANTITFKYVIIEDVVKHEVVNIINQTVPANGIVVLDKPVHNNQFFNNPILHLSDGSIVDLFDIATNIDNNHIIDINNVDLDIDDLTVTGLSISYLTKKN